MMMRLGQLSFHMGADYACVMGERQTTSTAIARLYGQSRDVEAYGNLFAAAAEMLAALKAAHGVIDEKRAPLTIQRIRDAIAKAEGRTPIAEEGQRS